MADVVSGEPVEERPVASGPRRHPSATPALVLGSVAVVGAVVLLPLLLAPLAWYLGAATRRDVEREPARWTGRGSATAAVWLGLAGSVLLAVVTLALVVLAAGALLAANVDTGY